MKDITLSIILTAANEPNTIKKALGRLLESSISFLKYDLELITVIPDEDTYNKAKEYINKKYKNINWTNIKDPHKGKPTALNLAFNKASGKYILLSDGDVYISKKAVPRLFDHFKNNRTGAVTGRAISIDDRNKLWGYLSHLLADAAHDKRERTLNKQRSLKGTPFFVISGYLSLIRNIRIKIPSDCLVDDAYISYAFFNKGYIIDYEPDAKVYVRYPKTLKDWMDQKARSVGGYMQLWKYDVITNETKVRDFKKELEYFAFPLKYAKNIKEFFYSLILYFLRLHLWIRIFIERRILKKDFYSTWVRIESTK